MKYLKIFTDFLEIAEGLSDNTLARLFRAMLAYALNDTEPAFKGNERALWLMVRQSIDREKEAYEAKVDSMERCREAKKQKEIKQKSMQPPKLSTEDKDKDKEKEKEKGKDKDKDIYMGGEPPAPKAHIYIQPPSLAEIETYCQERGNQVDPNYFYNYYQSNGWRVGKNPMRDWKAAVRAWEGNGVAERQAPAPKPSYLDSFRDAMELARRKEAREV